MGLIHLPQEWTRQPQRAVRLKPDDGFYYASVAGRSPTTGQFLTGITGERINADGRAGYINVGATAQDFGVSVPTGSWAILLNVALLAKPSSYPYLLGISGGPQASLSLNHLSHSGNATWYDGTNIYNSGISVAVGELATVGLVWDAAASTYTWYKNGIQGNTVSGVSTGTGTWRFRTYTDEGSENAINLIAFSNRAIPTARMRELTAKNGQWKIFEPDTLDLWIPAAGGGESLATGSSSGTASSNVIGASIAEATVSSTGTGVASGIGSSLSIATTSSSGIASVNGVGSSIAESVANSSGISVVSGVGSYIAEGNGTAASSGISVVSGIGTSLHSSIGSSSGTAAINGIGASLANIQAIGTSSGSSLVLGISVGAATAVLGGGKKTKKKKYLIDNNLVELTPSEFEQLLRDTQYNQDLVKPLKKEKPIAEPTVRGKVKSNRKDTIFSEVPVAPAEVVTKVSKPKKAAVQATMVEKSAPIEQTYTEDDVVMLLMDIENNHLKQMLKNLMDLYTKSRL